MTRQLPPDEMATLIGRWSAEILAYYRNEKPGMPVSDRWTDHASEALSAVYEGLDEPDRSAFEAAMRGLIEEKLVPSGNYLSVHFPFLETSVEPEW